MSLSSAPAVNPSSQRRETLIGLACAGMAVVLWTGFLLISRSGLSSGSLGPLDFGALRYGLSGAIMLPILFVLGLGNLDLKKMFALAATAGLGFGMLAYMGFTRAPAAHAAVLMPGSLPLYTSILAVAFLGERLGLLKGAALALILSGILCLAGTTLVDLNWRQLTGDALFACAAISWAIFTVLLRAWNVDPLRGVAAVCVGASVLYIPLWLLFAPKDGLMNAPTGEVVLQAIYQGIVATILAMLLFSRAVKALGAAVTTMVTAITPGAAALLAVPVLGEPLSAMAAIGVALVTLGIFGTVASLGRR